MWGFLCRVKFFNGNHWQRASPLQPQWRSFWLRSFRLSRHDRIRTSESHGCHGSKCQTPRIHQWVRWKTVYHVISLILAMNGHLRCPNQKSCSEILSSSTFRLLNLLVLVSSQGTGIEWIWHAKNLTYSGKIFTVAAKVCAQTQRERCIYIYIYVHYVRHTTV